jgi:hypothetical protein
MLIYSQEEDVNLFSLSKEDVNLFSLSKEDVSHRWKVEKQISEATFHLCEKISLKVNVYHAHKLMIYVRHQQSYY